MTSQAVGNVVLMYSLIFTILEYDSVTMAHLDPSETISTPFPFQQLSRFIASSLGWNLIVGMVGWFLSKHQKIQSKPDSSALDIVLMIGMATIIIHGSFILCGIHPKYEPLHTLVASLYVASNTMLPPIFLVNSEMYDNTQQHTCGFKRAILKLRGTVCYLVGPTQHTQQQTIRMQRLHHYATFGTVLGMALCSILRVLDHGMQIQRYPVPIIIGATWGRLGGLFVGEINRLLFKQK
eukprot:g13309.t1 g13309   contig8:376262-377078(-)